MFTWSSAINWRSREIRLQEAEVESEVERLYTAVQLAKQHLREVRQHIPASTPLEIAAFIDTHLLMLDDAAFSEEAARIVRQTRCNAEWAVKLQRDALVAVFDEMDDAYLRTRKDDVDHVVDRIIRNLMRHQRLRHEMPDQKLKDMIILASDLTPADLGPAPAPWGGWFYDRIRRSDFTHVDPRA